MELNIGSENSRYQLPADLSMCVTKTANGSQTASSSAASSPVAVASASGSSDLHKFGGRGSSWSREETSLLLDVYEVEMAKEDANFDKNSASLVVPKFQSIYRTISDFLRSHGYERSPMQVRERLKRLKRDVREHKQGEFTTRVSAIVGRSPYTRPSLIQQAAILNTEKMRSVTNNNSTLSNLNNNHSRNSKHNKTNLDGTDVNSNTNNKNNNSNSHHHVGGEGNSHSNGEGSERSVSETFYPADMLSTEMSYPDDDEPSSESPMSCNAEVPDVHSDCVEPFVIHENDGEQDLSSASKPVEGRAIILEQSGAGQALPDGLANRSLRSKETERLADRDKKLSHSTQLSALTHLSPVIEKEKRTVPTDAGAQQSFISARQKNLTVKPETAVLATLMPNDQQPTRQTAKLLNASSPARSPPPCASSPTRLVNLQQSSVTSVSPSSQPAPRLHRQSPPQPPLLPSFPHALPSHLSLNQAAMIFSLPGGLHSPNPAAVLSPLRLPLPSDFTTQLPTQQHCERSRSPSISRTRTSTPPAGCSNCLLAAAEQRKIYSILQKVLGEQKAAHDNQLAFQREILAHLNMITYSVQTLATHLAFNNGGASFDKSQNHVGKTIVGLTCAKFNSPHSQDDDATSLNGDSR